ncbi:RNA polymerase sigma factor [Enterococcus diestrammenae]|uniref:RNA polymerase sigma factor n=1 Tax=Enterococcus diestrammenae TaxID=1155073 RepID=UPI0019568D6C
MKNDEMEELFKEYHELLYRVLRRGGIFPTHSYFEDYWQELSLALFQLMKKAPDRISFLADYNESWLFSHLLWRLADVRRYQKRHVKEELLDVPVEELLQTTPVAKLGAAEALERDALLLGFWDSLKPKQQRQLEALWQEKCQKQSVSPALLSYYRIRLRQIFKKFCENF